ncbi:MAG: hypothetical protein ACTTID_03305 [Bacillales bacterium]
MNKKLNKILLLPLLISLSLPLSSCRKNKSKYENVENNPIEQEKINQKLNNIHRFNSDNSYFDNKFDINNDTYNQDLNIEAKVDINLKVSFLNFKIDGDLYGFKLNDPNNINYYTKLKYKSSDVAYINGNTTETTIKTSEFKILWYTILQQQDYVMASGNLKNVGYFFTKQTLTIEDFDILFSGKYFKDKKYNKIINPNKTTSYVVKYNKLTDIENFKGVDDGKISNLEFGPVLSDETNVLLGFVFKCKYLVAYVDGSILLK